MRADAAKRVERACRGLSWSPDFRGKRIIEPRAEVPLGVSNRLSGIQSRLIGFLVRVREHLLLRRALHTEQMKRGIGRRKGRGVLYDEQAAVDRRRTAS
jgi:hypothetical protein